MALILPSGKKLYPNLDAIIKKAVLEAYERHHESLYATAIELKIGRVTLYRYFKKWGIKREGKKFERVKTKKMACVRALNGGKFG